MAMINKMVSILQNKMSQIRKKREIENKKIYPELYDRLLCGCFTFSSPFSNQRTAGNTEINSYRQTRVYKSSQYTRIAKTGHGQMPGYAQVPHVG